MLAGYTGLAALATGVLNPSSAVAGVTMSDDPMIRELQEKIDDAEYPHGAVRIVPNGGEWLATREWGGKRRRPRTYGPHNGVDFRARYGEHVLAAADGIAYFSRVKFGGNQILIFHRQKRYSDRIPYTVNTVYAHLSRVSSKIKLAGNSGVYVLRGEVIGEVGTSGGDIIPHLHWGASMQDLRGNRKWYFINPLQLLAGGPGRFVCFEEGKSCADLIELTHPS